MPPADSSQPLLTPSNVSNVRPLENVENATLTAATLFDAPSKKKRVPILIGAGVGGALLLCVDLGPRAALVVQDRRDATNDELDGDRHPHRGGDGDGDEHGHRVEHHDRGDGDGVGVRERKTTRENGPARSRATHRDRHVHGTRMSSTIVARTSALIVCAVLFSAAIRLRAAPTPRSRSRSSTKGAS